MLCFGLYTYVKAMESRAAAAMGVMGASSKGEVVHALVSNSAPEQRPLTASQDSPSDDDLHAMQFDATNTERSRV